MSNKISLSLWCKFLVKMQSITHFIEYKDTTQAKSSLCRIYFHEKLRLKWKEIICLKLFKKFRCSRLTLLSYKLFKFG